VPPDPKLIVPGLQPAAPGIALTFELLESDIEFDGITVSTSWLDSPTLAPRVTQQIERQYAATDTAIIRIEGVANAREVIHFLRALKQQSTERPRQALTHLALLKS
jgi:hypothetical protein